MCAGKRLDSVIELTPTPPGNHFLREEEIGRVETVYPLELFLCEDCGHLQLADVVDPRILYQENYSYVSGTSLSFVSHLESYVEDAVERFSLTPGRLVADIGSNDGTCLRFFRRRNMRVVGIDPAIEIAARAKESGIETVADFFSFELAKSLFDEYGAAGLITSHNTCAHIDDLDDVLRGVSYWLDDDGVFVLEVGYFYDVYRKVWFDTIYHEHLDFHTVGPFQRLFGRFDMEIVHVERVSPQGGSIRIGAQKKGGKRATTRAAEGLIELERVTGLYEKDSYVAFNERISTVRHELSRLLDTLKNEGATIAGYGAPTKATTLMAHFRLGKNELDFIVDDNPLKQGRYTPLTHIPVLPAEALFERRPDYVLILAWNFADSIMKAHRKYGDEVGRFILPMPVPRIAA